MSPASNGGSEFAAARETRWQRLKCPHSYNPRDGLTRVRWFWRLDVHLPAAYWRARYWWWGKRGF